MQVELDTAMPPWWWELGGTSLFCSRIKLDLCRSRATSLLSISIKLITHLTCKWINYPKSMCWVAIWHSRKLKGGSSNLEKFKKKLISTPLTAVGTPVAQWCNKSYKTLISLSNLTPKSPFTTCIRSVPLESQSILWILKSKRFTTCAISNMNWMT